MKKRLHIRTVVRPTVLTIGVVAVMLFAFFFVGYTSPSQEILWGVNFSGRHAENLGLDWKETYLALLDDLGVKRVKLNTQWDRLEPKQDIFDFENLDWQVKEAEERGVKILLIVGMKTSRWPECHIPEWASTFSREKQQEEIKELLTAVVGRYKTSPAVWGWQVENEPLFPYGECPWKDKEFLKTEVALVKSLDPGRPVVVSDSGEWSLWFEVAKIGDVVGTTLYRKVWFDELNLYTPYPLPPVFYHRKAKLVGKLFGKKVINIELQAEPWGPGLLYDLPLEEQEKTMNPDRFRNVIEYAKKTGLGEFYFWGAEWWFWLKETHNDDAIWNEARRLFHE